MNLVVTAALAAANAAACAREQAQISYDPPRHKGDLSLPRRLMSSKEFGGGGTNGRPLVLENIMGTRPVPRELSGKSPGGGGGKMELGARVRLGGGKRPNGDGKLIFALPPIDDGGKGRGHAELVVVVVVVVADGLAVVVEGFSVEDVVVWLVDGDVDDLGLVLFVAETVLLAPESSVSVFSMVNVSVNRVGLEEMLCGKR